MSKELFMKFYQAETEEEIAGLLSKENMDQNPDDWKAYGGIKGNHAVIANQSSSAERALVEKITNAIDAVLMRKCYEKGWDPKDMTNPHLPKTPTEAINYFYDVKDGKIENLTKEQEEEIYNDLVLFATSSDQKPIKQLGTGAHINLTMLDMGEGQVPDEIPRTILSLLTGNKKGISFAQGEHNQGGSGCVVFCGKSRYCLVISKRHPGIPAEFNPKDADVNEWGWTLVRLEMREGERNPVFTYYAPGGKVPRFKADTLPLKPTVLRGKKAQEYLDYDKSCTAGIPYTEEVTSGTAFKLFNYNLKQKGPLVSHFKYELSRYILDTYVPIKVIDCRKNKFTNDFIFRGLKKLIEDDRKEKEEKRLFNEKFPITTTFQVGKQPVQITVYGLNHRKQGEKNANSLIGDSYPIRCTLGQQFQGGLPKSVISNAGLGIVKDDLLIVAEFPEIDPYFRLDLFLPDRERLADKKPKKEIAEQIKTFLKVDTTIQEFASEKMKSLMQAGNAEDTDVKAALEKWIENDPDILNTLGGIMTPKRLQPPSSSDKPREKEKAFTDFNDIPTYFELLHPVVEGNHVITVTKGNGFLVRFKTDAYPDFLKKKGTVQVKLNGRTMTPAFRTDEPGKVFFYFTKKVSNTIGEKLLSFKIEGEGLKEPFVHALKVVIKQKPEKKVASGLPEMREITKENWADIPGMNERTGAGIAIQGDTVVYWVNMDNQFYRKKLDQVPTEGEKEFYKKLYKYAMLFAAMAAKNAEEAYRKEHPEEETESVEEAVAKATEAVARTFFVTEQLSANLRKNFS